MMSLHYCFWTSVREKDNGDAEIAYHTANDEVIGNVTVPVAERYHVARELLSSQAALEQDVERFDGDTYKTVYAHYKALRLERSVNEEHGPDDFECFRMALEAFDRSIRQQYQPRGVMREG